MNFAFTVCVVCGTSFQVLTENLGRPLTCPPCRADEVHVTPEFPGERSHQHSLLCWCDPRRDSEEPLLVIHARVAQA